MSEAKSVNGFLIKQKDGEWWIKNFGDTETITGPFPTEARAIEVASVLQLEHPAPAKRRGKDKT
ncbi:MULTISPECIES: hypothetical protein [Pseudomonas]|jgi:hypothetical protein|uniref:hypothetical protein n=1 Tax=Pseudomonas TaxID=286 RepID=UPI000488920D|nr:MULTISPECIES: hypothetical protein [Pseudomonas]MBF6039376.1 hypothetical protein [Pseudomonas mucoides]CRL52408.1 hypothetical protein PSHI_56200 [Pseudomonas sp. URMO17WK12:I11]